MPFFSAPKLTDEDALRGYARVLVRAGLTDDDACVAEVAVAAREDAGLSDAEGEARRLVARERDSLVADQASWPSRTDYDALQDAFAALGAAGYTVLQGVDDHWGATAVLRASEPGSLRGVVWFTPADVWHAVDHGMLEINVWHADSANVADGDPLCTEVLAALDAQGLAAHFDEGRIEVRAFWHRRRTDTEAGGA
ncbi:hypothetical protein FE697_006615 [Mumia zhuanghuii]|uniref:DUF6891 domain-containing protein n=2 Tax=Mumia TaxID=1546255 RepID=A0ABW1QML7_9ACTN|nr:MULTISPECIES: hypothetical protein [Mumia]KAA1423290.1 hypothetical protein FE697_006615 [Mumia zhuanghuii]